MTAASPFTLRPLERPSGGSSLDQAAFRVHLSPKELKNLGLSAGDRIRLSTAKGFHGFALAWLAQQTNPGNKPIAKVSDLLREKYALALTDAVFIDKVQEAPRFATSVHLAFPPSSEALERYATDHELEYFARFPLGRHAPAHLSTMY
jgi:AAA family ATPase